MTFLSARSILVFFCTKKNLTSKGSKPIGILTYISLSYSDYRLPTGYSLHDFQPHQSNFLNPPPPWQVEYKLNFQSKKYVHYTSTPQTSWSQAVFTVKNTTYTTLLSRKQVAHRQFFLSKIGRTLHFYAAAAITRRKGVDTFKKPWV